MTSPDFRRVDRAAVWVDDRRAATLARDPGGICFAYVEGYDGPAVATSLPTGHGPTTFPGGAIGPFFAGLLPEGRRLSAIRRATKTSADDDLTMLLAVGADTVGNVRILPHDESAAPIPEVGPRLDEVDFADLFADLLRAPTRERHSIPGVQDKVSGRMISLPVKHANASWILKLDPPEHAHLVANEAFFLRAAAESGLDAAHATVVHDRSGRPGLLVRRFDRMHGNDGIRSLPQEDACQVLGRYPADKYRLTTEDVIVGLSRRCGAPIVAARTLLQQFAFAYLTCNGDAHAKNFSIHRPDQEWCVCPAYDLPSTHPYGDMTMALTLQGREREDIRRADFVALGEHCGVPAKATERLLDGLVAKAPQWIDRLLELPFDARAMHKLQRACRYRADRLEGK